MKLSFKYFGIYDLKFLSMLKRPGFIFSVLHFLVLCNFQSYDVNLRLDSNIAWKSSNSTYLNIIKLLFLIYIFFYLKFIEWENLVTTGRKG